MNEVILYALDRENIVSEFRPINGNRVQRKEIPRLEFTLKNVERFLREQFQEVNVSEEEWPRKQGRPVYNLSIEVDNTKTIEQIDSYLFEKLQQRPRGNRNFADLDIVHLFRSYQVGSETFHLKFSNVISPYRKR